MLCGKEIYKGKIENMPIKEDYILNESINLFMDDDPCIIHRSLIIKKFLMKFIDELKKISTSGEINLKLINPNIINQFDIEQCGKAVLRIL
jgi:hypothetical protein